jgi:hypothetical protein
MSRHKNTRKNIWARINILSPNECWEVVGKLRNGCGVIMIDYKNYYAHRIIYEEIFGSIPEGLLIRHTCNNRKCCNPNHLKLGTYQDNSNDMVFGGRSSSGEKRYNSKLTKLQISEIRNLYSTGKYTQEYIGILYEVTIPTIWKIIHKISRS